MTVQEKTILRKSKVRLRPIACLMQIEFSDVRRSLMIQTPFLMSSKQGGNRFILRTHKPTPYTPQIVICDNKS